MDKTDETNDLPTLAEAKSNRRQFYQDLERLLKKHQPVEYAPYAARRLRQSWGQDKLMAQSPPHYLLHSIEANCCYARGHRNVPVDYNRLARVMNVYHKYPDPLQIMAAATNIIHFGLALYREQMEIQRAFVREDLARTWELFIADKPLPLLSREFATKYGLTFDDWLRLCIVTFAVANADERGCFTQQKVASYEHLHVGPSGIESFFSQSSLKPDEIGQRYRNERNSVPLHCHSLVRSVFLEYPMIDFGGGRTLAPHPPLILRHSSEGLYRLTKDLPSFDIEFGKAVEHYIGKVLGFCHDKSGLLTSKDLEDSQKGKTCDFVLDTPDVVVLVESKATSFGARFFTETAIRQDGSTAKVARGMEQLYATAYDIAQGDLRKLGIDHNKPILGIVVSFGELPFANSDWYFENAFLARVADHLRAPVYPSCTMTRRPMVISVPTLELMIQAANSTHSSMLSLYDSKALENYVLTGDWDAYLRSKLQALGEQVEQLPFLREDFEAFFETLGPPRVQE